jgi:cytidyltransferase-like protein
MPPQGRNKTMGASSNGSNIGSSVAELGNNAVARATEGWLELFLTPAEKHNFSQWNEIVKDHSLVHKVTGSYLDRLSLHYLPATLAPNVLTLSGFIMLGQAWYLTNEYGDSHPVACSWLAAATILLFFITSSATCHHADRIKQHTALSDLFKYCCDSGSTVWIAMLTTFCLGGKQTETQWYAVQACQLVLFLKHLSAFRRQAGLRYHFFQGPGEVLLGCIALLGLRAIIGLDRLGEALKYVYQTVLLSVAHFGATETKDSAFEGLLALDKSLMESDEPVGDKIVRYAYYLLFTSAVVQCLRLPFAPHGWTRFGLTTSLLMRLVPALLLRADISFPVTVTDVICDGFFLTVLTSDLTLAKMAQRELHPWVVMMSLAATLSYGFILTLVFVYYIAVFCDLSSYLNLPLLATCRNVYCDGVYDLCHIGHKRAFQNSLALGNRLFVGVVGDDDASKYKRPPVMSHAERCAEVEACKSVTKVIPNAPCFGLTQEFLDTHQIHVVAFGEEYLTKYPDPADDPYYSLPRQQGIAYPLPRTNSLSTSDLIRRIQEIDSASLAKKSPT